MADPQARRCADDDEVGAPWNLYAYDGTRGRWNNQAGPEPMMVQAIPPDAARSRLSLARKLWPIRDVDLNAPAQHCILAKLKSKHLSTTSQLRLDKTRFGRNRLLTARPRRH